MSKEKTIEETYEMFYDHRATQDAKMWKYPDAFHDVHENMRMELTKMLAGSTKGKRILDLGSSECGLLEYLQDFKEYIGIDISKIRLNKAIKKWKHISNIKLLHLNVEDSTIRKLGTFDIIFCLELLEHVLDPMKLLENIKCLSHKKTRIVISVPDGNYIKPEGSVGHLRTFSPGVLIQILYHCGFVPVKFKTFLGDREYLTTLVKIGKIERGSKRLRLIGDMLAHIFMVVKLK